MPNHGYADNDDSREPQGQHDLGRQRNSCYDAYGLIRPGLVSDQPNRADVANIMSDSEGDVFFKQNVNYPVDGDAGDMGRNYLPAAYPAYVQAK